MIEVEVNRSGGELAVYATAYSLKWLRRIKIYFVELIIKARSRIQFHCTIFSTNVYVWKFHSQDF